MQVGQIVSVFLWFAFGAVFVLAGFYAVMAVRRWSHREERITTFTFQDLRDMRARGEITEQEFVAVRNALLARLDDDLRPPPSPSSLAPPPDEAPPPAS